MVGYSASVKQSYIEYSGLVALRAALLCYYLQSEDQRIVRLALTIHQIRFCFTKTKTKIHT